MSEKTTLGNYVDLLDHYIDFSEKYVYLSENYCLFMRVFKFLKTSFFFNSARAHNFSSVTYQITTEYAISIDKSSTYSQVAETVVC